MNPRLLERWNMYVDGENLAMRAKNAIAEIGGLRQNFYEPDTFVWPPGQDACSPHPWLEYPFQTRRATRAYYYTSVTGDQPKIAGVMRRLKGLGFEPTVLKRPAEGRSKGVDISLTCDMITHAHNNLFDTCVLVTGDGDYVPLIREVKRLGKYVFVAGFKDHGFSSELEKAADFVCDLSDRFAHRIREAITSG